MGEVAVIISEDQGPWFLVHKKSGPKRWLTSSNTSYAGARVLIYSEILHYQANWTVMSICPCISFPGEKSIWKIQLPSEGCLENAESWLEKLNYPENTTMKIQQTNEPSHFPTEIDLPSRLNTLPSLVQETAYINALSPPFFRNPPVILGICVYLNFIILLHFMCCYNKPILNFKLLMYLWYFAGRLLPWWLFVTYNPPFSPQKHWSNQGLSGTDNLIYVVWLLFWSS